MSGSNLASGRGDISTALSPGTPQVSHDDRATPYRRPRPGKRRSLGPSETLIAFVLTPFGTVMGGFAAAGLRTRTAILLSGCLSGACALVIFVPGMREPERIEVEGN